MKEWKIERYDDNEYYIDTIDDEEIAHLNNGKYVDVKTNAKLISKSPKLLDLAKNVVLEIGHYGFANKSTLNKLEQTIREIEGDDEIESMDTNRESS